MAIGSGLGGSVGFGVETTYGTFVAPTKFPEMQSATFQRKPNFVQGGGLAAGRFVQPSGRYVLTHREAEATVNMEVPSKGFGFLLQQLMGGSAAPVIQGATAAYLQTYTLADTKGKSVSLQIGSPNTAGTVSPYTLLGSKVTAIEFACGVGELLTAGVSFDCQDYSESQGLSAPSFLTGIVPRNFSEMNVKIGAFGSEAAVTGVRKVTTKVSRAMKTDMQYANAGGKKAEPILNDWADISGTIDTDFVNKADWADRVPLSTPVSIVWEFIGPLIASTFFQTFRITMSSCVIESGDPNLDGPDVVNPSFSFSALDDQVNQPIKIEYMSTDVTV